jgi:hypothetical protein
MEKVSEFIGLKMFEEFEEMEMPTPLHHLCRSAMFMRLSRAG